MWKNQTNSRSFEQNLSRTRVLFSFPDYENNINLLPEDKSSELKVYNTVYPFQKENDVYFGQLPPKHIAIRRNLSQKADISRVSSLENLTSLLHLSPLSVLVL